jgi:hypothetical protein
MVFFVIYNTIYSGSDVLLSFNSLDYCLIIQYSKRCRILGLILFYKEFPMKKMLTVLAIAALTAFVSLPVFAQPATFNTLGSLESNTSFSTSGLFKNDIDNFINYHKYSSVLTDEAKWFGFITGRNIAGGVLDAGYARNFGNIYFGVWYRGNIFKENGGSVTSSISPTWDNNREVLLETTEITTYAANWQESDNQFEFLIGVAGHGIKVGFLESYASDQNEGFQTSTVIDYQDGRKDYTGATDIYENRYGYLKPYLGWGTSFSISGMNLMPYADLGLQIYGNKLVNNYQSYTEVNGVRQNVVGTVGAGNNSGYLQPYGIIGAKLDLAKKDTVQTQVELRYGIDLRFYDNSFDDTGLSGSAGGTVGWGTGYVNRVTDSYTDTTTDTDITFNIDEISYIRHVITPTYKVTGEPDENFKVGFSASVPITITSGSNLRYSDRYQIQKIDYKADKSMNTETITKTRTYNGTDSAYNTNTEFSDFNIMLRLNLGASYKLIPDRFTINAGIRAEPASYTHNIVKNMPNHVNRVITTETTDAAGNKTETKSVTPATGYNNEDSVVVKDTWDQWSANLYGGFVFNFNSMATLDMGVNAGSGSGNGFNLDLTTVNVIFTIKY